MIQPEADQLELALRLGRELHACLLEIEKSPNLTAESKYAVRMVRRDLHFEFCQMEPAEVHNPWWLKSILERAREQSSGQV